MKARRTRQRRRGVWLPDPPNFFASPKQRKQRKPQKRPRSRPVRQQFPGEDLLTSRLFWAIVAIGVFFWSLDYAADYVRGLLAGEYVLRPGPIVISLLAPTALAIAGLLLYRRIRRLWRRFRPPTPVRPVAPGAVSREPIPAGLRFAVLRRDGFRCAYCGRGEQEGVRLHLDHLVPVARGGRTDLDNLVTSCADCNLGKSASNLVGEHESDVAAPGT